MKKSTDKNLPESSRNITWELNHSIIRDSYVDLIKKLRRKPTYDEVSEDCNLSTQTIKKHIDTLEFDPLKHPLRILSDDVLISIANSAKKGSSASQKLWMQICEGWRERHEIEHGASPSLTELIKDYQEQEKSNKKGEDASGTSK